MHDLKEEPGEPSTYECMKCGNILEADERPTRCPECGTDGSFRNRAMSLE